MLLCHCPPLLLLCFTVCCSRASLCVFLQLPLSELFAPVWEYKPRDPSDKLSSLWARGAVAAVLGCCCWALLVMGPDAQTVKSSVQDAQDSVLKYFVSVKI